jgi:chorismate mutase
VMGFAFAQPILRDQSILAQSIGDRNAVAIEIGRAKQKSGRP